MRKLATIQKIKKLIPIEGADFIQIATFEGMGWQCIVKKDEFKEEDLAVYFEIDSLLPLKPEFEFLAKQGVKESMLEDGTIVKGYRLRSMKMRGQLSQGLALPVSILPKNKSYSLKEDVTKILNIYKYEKIEKAQPQTKLTPLQVKLIKLPIVGKYIKGLILPKQELPFPDFIPKTDEERIQNCYEDIKPHFNQEWVANIKYDGSSLTLAKKDNCVYICSRNLTKEKINTSLLYKLIGRFFSLSKTVDNNFSKVVRKKQLHINMPNNFAIQGELIGPSIQKNLHRVKDLDLIVFNVFDIKKQEFLDYEKAKQFAERLGLTFVSEYKRYSSLEGLTIEDFLKEADKTKLEGLVFRPLVQPNKFNRLSFKAISNNYLLKHEE